MEDQEHPIMVPYKGRQVPNIPGVAERLDDFSVNFKARSDDIWLCGFPKCGTHWINEVVYMLKENSLTRGPAKENFFLEMTSHQSWEKLESPRILNTHLTYTLLPESVVKDSRIIFFVRNAKDVVVSSYNHMLSLHEGWVKMNGGDINVIKPLTWEQFAKRFMDTSDFLTYHKEWMGVLSGKPSHDNILLVIYEEMKESPVEQIAKLAKFLGMDREGVFYEQVAAKTDIKAMKADRGNETFVMPENPDNLLPIGKLYRKGEIGDWRNWFTKEQNEAFNKEYLESMGSLRVGVEKYMDL